MSGTLTFMASPFEPSSCSPEVVASPSETIASLERLVDSQNSTIALLVRQLDACPCWCLVPGLPGADVPLEPELKEVRPSAPPAAKVADTSEFFRKILELEIAVEEIRRSPPLDTMSLIGNVRSMCSEIVRESSGLILSKVETLVMNLAQELLSRIAAVRLELGALCAGDHIDVSHAAGFSGTGGVHARDKHANHDDHFVVPCEPFADPSCGAAAVAAASRDCLHAAQYVRGCLDARDDEFENENGMENELFR